MSADRNLLFGVLALQMDFIDRDQLVRAMHAWVLDKKMPLGEILLEQQALASDCHALVQAMVHKHLQMHGDDPQRSLAAVQAVRSVREDLSRVADAEVQASLGLLAATPTGPGAPATLAWTERPRAEGAGRFRVLRPHAKGGLGEVSVALDGELRRQVALKEIRPEHADNPAARARFLLEAEVTGQLEHPGVVPVYGLGHYPDGRPYYAMRFVEGDSLHEAIRHYHRAAGQEAGARALAFRHLLGRFVDVCNAVAYAHSKGVLHRDLKPGNVLLGPYGETLVVDWGLAKLTGTAEPEQSASTVPLTVFEAGGVTPTVAGQVLGTPGYMAPEQAAGEVERLGPATDVYGLGATLYQLLTDRPPFDGRSASDVLERVQKGDFPRPRQVKGDVPPALEAVCLKAMALRPEDRYAAPRALAEELERWLGDEPVGAYPERLAARAGRWVRRHKAVTAAAAALLLTAVVALSVGLVLLGRANARTEEQRALAEESAAAAREQEAKAKEAADQAKAVNRFLTEDLLAEAAPEKNPRQKKVTVEEVLDKAAAKVDKGFPGQPEVEATVRHAVGVTYWRLGKYAQARPQMEKALALRRERLGPDHPDTLRAVNNLANLLRDQGKLAEAEPLYRQNLEAQRRVSGPDHPETLTSVNNLALVLRDQGKLAQAEPLFRQNLEAHRRVLGPDHPETLTSVNNLAGLLRDQGKLTEAEPLLRQNLEASGRVRGPDHPMTLMAVDNLAQFLQAQGKRAEAEPMYRQNLEASRRVQGVEHPFTLRAVNDLASLLQDQGKLAEAEPLLHQNLEAHRRLLGPDHPFTLAAVNNLAALLRARGKLAEAEPLFRQNLEAQRRVSGPDHPYTLASGNNLARLLREQGKLAEAESLAREALDRGRKTLPAGHPYIANILSVLGDVLTDRGRPTEAEPLLREALEQRRKGLPPGHPNTARVESQLGACLAAQKKYAEAEPLLLTGYQILAKDPGTPEAERRRARQRLVQLYETWGKPTEAAKWKAERDRGSGTGAPKSP